MSINRKHWIEKFNIPDKSDVIFYQNPEFFRSNTFERDYITDPDLRLKRAIYKMYTVTGICNSHHKHAGKRQKICLVIERERISATSSATVKNDSLDELVNWQGCE